MYLCKLATKFEKNCMVSKENIGDSFRSLQDEICHAIETTDQKGKFKEDAWHHHSGGGGRTRVLTDGRILEKGGVNFSEVQGKTSPALQKQLNLSEEADYFATGVSIVMHPLSPQVPIIHMNVRYFEMSNGIWWFGGGIDLTPHYIVPAQAQWFHQQLESVCRAFDENAYEEYKTWADRYFYLPHRQETRGVGGIFFDYLSTDKLGKSKEEIHQFVLQVGKSFAPIYTHLMTINADKPYTESEKQWQYVRRGRYVEFNLVWDRGTKFGLETNGRTESILMSLPPTAQWHYDFQIEPGSPEDHTNSLLRQGVNWLSMEI